VPRISDLAHFHASSLGKLELDMMGTHQMSERQVLDAILARRSARVFSEYVDEHGLGEIADIFAKGVKIEVGDMLPSRALREIVKRVPPSWEKAFEVNASEDPAVRASCVEFVLAGLWATERVSRSERFGTGWSTSSGRSWAKPKSSATVNWVASESSVMIAFRTSVNTDSEPLICHGFNAAREWSPIFRIPRSDLSVYVNSALTLTGVLPGSRRRTGLYRSPG
jgi:hypothetical protein